jgi:hypothetical protein
MIRPFYVQERCPMSDKGEIILYQDKAGEMQIEVRMEDETVWLSQAQMAELFHTDQSGIARHLQNIFKSGELEEKDNVRKKRIIGSNKPVNFYNLNVIISVGYRVNSKRGTQFRIWATKLLREHLANSLQQVFQSQIEALFHELYSLPSEGVENDKSGYVYLLQSSTGYYKIGRTSDPENRIKTFAVKMPFEIEYLHLIPTKSMAETERQLHHHFADKRVGGEWFALNNVDVATIKAWQSI